MTGPPAVPRATLRLQFSQAFRFDDATALVPYLAGLGVSHVYASPFLQARAGSTHGYDIIDHSQVNREIGDSAAFDRLVDALHAHGMGLILDFVPNHMGVGGNDNPWWLDVLEWGQDSPFAPFFDIDWTPPEPALHGKVLLPFLGDHYGNVLERGELALRLDEARGTFSVWYFNHRFPIAVHGYPRMLRAVQSASGTEDAALAGLINGFTGVAAASGGKSVPQLATLRHRVDELKAQLAALVAGNPAVAQAIAALVAQINGVPGQPDSFLELHRLLEEQAYRIAFWRVAADAINYRRFFDINDLAGLRIEQPELFELAHQLVFRLIGDGKLQGLRLDHIDGLYDPVGYCEQLQEHAAYRLLHARVAEAAPAAAGPAGVQLRQPFYLLVEKILAHHEHLREGWPVSGTSGYEFMNLVNGLFVDPAGESALTEAYTRFIGRDTDFETVLLAAKRRIIETSLASELNVLAGELHRLAGQNWRTRDYTVTGMRRALTDIVVFLPVYRTYITAERVGDEDRKYLDWAVGRARKHADAVDTTIYDFLHAALTTDLATTDLARGGPGYGTEDVLRVALKFQQYTGPVMAKSFEDTALYRYFRLVSLNEVGGDPARFGTTPAAFHHVNQERLRRFPFSLLATATHDHKRGEDTRARINVLSELPAHWSRAAWSWSRLNRARKRDVDGAPAPDLNDEYLLYQTLVGIWPLDPGSPADLADTTERVVAYMVKAAREAKRLSSWASPNAEYEDALERFIRGILDPVRNAAFLAEFQEFQGRVARIGAVNGLAQTLLKLTVPGVPDLYQGTEFWDLSLVDPDNRRPVDYAARQTALALDSATAGAPDIAARLAGWRDGRIKQHVIARTLDCRRREPALFAIGDYVPVEAAGAGADRVIAFLRRHGSALVLVVVPRLVAPLLGGNADESEDDHEGPLPLVPPARWGDTVLRLPALPEVASLTDTLTGAELALPADGGLAVSAVLSAFPVALLVHRPDTGG